MAPQPLKIVYITPSIHTADGAARVLTMKANYFAEHFGYDITILLTEGKGLPFFYHVSAGQERADAYPTRYHHESTSA